MAFARGKTFEGEGGLLGELSADEHHAQLEAAAAASRARRMGLTTAAPAAVADVESDDALRARLLAEMREAEARAFCS